MTLIIVGSYLFGVMLGILIGFNIKENEMLKSILTRFLKGLGASGLAFAAAHVTGICSLIHGLPNGICVPLLTGLILAIEKGYKFKGGN